LFGGDISFLIESGKEDIGAMQTNSCLRDRNYMLHACGVTDGTKIASTSAICLPPTRIMMMLLLSLYLHRKDQHESENVQSASDRRTRRRSLMKLQRNLHNNNYR